MSVEDPNQTPEGQTSFDAQIDKAPLVVSGVQEGVAQEVNSVVSEKLSIAQLSEINDLTPEMAEEAVMHLRTMWQELRLPDKNSDMLYSKNGYYRVSRNSLNVPLHKLRKVLWQAKKTNPNAILKCIFEEKFEPILRNPSNAKALLGVWKSMKSGGEPAILDFDFEKGILIGETFNSPLKDRENIVYDKLAEELTGVYCNGNAEKKSGELGVPLMTREIAENHLIAGNEQLLADYLQASGRKYGEAEILNRYAGKKTILSGKSHTTHMQRLGFRCAVRVPIPVSQARKA